MTAPAPTTIADDPAHAPVDAPMIDTAVARLVVFLETGEAPDGLFAPTVFSDVSLPRWRVQTDTAEGIVALRRHSHPAPGRVTVERVDHHAAGFTAAIEERWTDDQDDWYCREHFRADVTDAGIVDFAVYCTGDWDAERRREHAAQVRLIRP